MWEKEKERKASKLQAARYILLQSRYPEYWWYKTMRINGTDKMYVYCRVVRHSNTGMFGTCIVVWQPTRRKIAPEVAEIGKESGVSSYRIMLNSTLTEF